ARVAGVHGVRDPVADVVERGAGVGDVVAGPQFRGDRLDERVLDVDRLGRGQVVPGVGGEVHHSPRSDSMPTVRRSIVGTLRTARRTPGMNDSRFIESCRMVNSSPCPPSTTSWCAMAPDMRTACTRTPSTFAPRAP